MSEIRAHRSPDRSSTCSSDDNHASFSEDRPAAARPGGGSAGERALLIGYLRDQRLALETKCTGLGPVEMACRAVPPSALSLLGLVRHLAGVEQYWFRQVMAGQQVTRHFRPSGGRDEEFEGAAADQELVAQAWEAWRAEIAFAEGFVTGAPDLDLAGTGADGRPVPLREVLVHLIEEYARHNGHAELLRASIEGGAGR